MAWGPDGALYVALAGKGGATPGIPEMPPPIGPFKGGPTASVVRIKDGCPVPVAEGLPSTLDAEGGVAGVADLAFLGGRLYALIAAGGAIYGNPGLTNGVYRVNADGTTALAADTTAWLVANPPLVSTAPTIDMAHPSYPFAMVADEARGVLWVVDADNALILTVSPDGSIALAADLSAERFVPTGIALAPEGGVLVGNLTPLPFPDSAATAVHIAPDGTVTEVWAGLTAVTGIAVGPDGELYALEMSTGNTEDPPFLRHHSGRLIRQIGKTWFEELVTGLQLPVALDVGPDGALYVAQPAFGAQDRSGIILRIAAGARIATPEDDAMAALVCPHPVATERPQ